MTDRNRAPAATAPPQQAVLTARTAAIIYREKRVHQGRFILVIAHKVDGLKGRFADLDLVDSCGWCYRATVDQLHQI